MKYPRLFDWKKDLVNINEKNKVVLTLNTVIMRV